MKSKIVSIIVMILLIVCLISVSVNAVSFTATMTPSATTVKEATEFTITVKVSNLDVGNNGINSLKGNLKYDTNVFETISESSIEGLNSWSAKFDEASGEISLTKNTFVTSTQEVFQIVFKTKSGVSGKSGTISYTNIVASNSETSIPATDISTAITIGNETNTNTVSNIASISNKTVTINAATTNNTVANNAVTNNTTNTNKTANNSISSYVNTMTNTQTQNNIPKTGVNDTILAVLFIVIAIAVVFYIKIEKLNKEIK